MRYAVEFTPEGEVQLTALYEYIAIEVTPVSAERYVTAILDYCASLATFPKRSPARDEIQPGLRITHYRGRTVIAYTVDDTAGLVSVLGF